MKYLLGFLLLFVTFSAEAEIVAVLETPAEVTVSQGVSVVRGFVVSDTPVVLVRMSIDEGEWLSVPYGSTRKDVAAVYADAFPDAENSGFSSTVNWRHFDPQVIHTILLQAISVTGEVAEVEREFLTTRLNPLDDFMKEADLKFSSYEAIPGGFSLRGVFLGGTLYEEIQFEWNNATQNFTLTKILYARF